MPDMMESLLSEDEPSAYRLEREQGRSAFFIICDHAGAVIPRQLNSLGLSGVDLERHIALDIGAASVALRLAELLDACVILQTYSRLVIDCNRPIGSPSSIVAVSESTRIPGNEVVSSADAVRREREVFRPYHDRIRELLDARMNRAQATLLISMHSFTPVFLAAQRPWHAAVLYNRDGRLARSLLHVLRRDSTLMIGENEPYAVSDTSDYAIPEYGEKRGIPHVEIEIRQDLIADEAGQRAWAARLAAGLQEAQATRMIQPCKRTAWQSL
jgi:predicted N-formylglutamate amidohydrolase